MEPNRQSQCAPAAKIPAATALNRQFLLAAMLALAAGAALRVWFLVHWFNVEVDSLVYGGLAKNLLLGIGYDLTSSGGLPHPSLIRLPGYPLFLAACFRLFGMENYFAPGCVQIVFELAGCAFLAAFAGKMARSLRPSYPRFARHAALATLWISGLCPFTASYAFRSMAETLTLFCLALAMFATAWFWERPGWLSALLFTFAVTYCTLLRPDGALAVVAFAPVMLLALVRSGKTALLKAGMALVCVLLALAPFAAWAWRNWQVFGVFQPLAPRLATEPGEPTNPGWESWVKSWSLDFVSTYNIYWEVPDDTLDVSLLPSRAFDSQAQYEETATLARDYNNGGKKLTDDLDARFARLAGERIAAHPWRSRLWLPLGRMADMWLRPRTENVPIALYWWKYEDHPGQTIFAWSFAGMNAVYLLLAAVGLWLRPRFGLALLAYMILRSALLCTVEAPEARYTLECFPMLFALGGLALAVGMEQLKGRIRKAGTPQNPSER